LRKAHGGFQNGERGKIRGGEGRGEVSRRPVCGGALAQAFRVEGKRAAGCNCRLGGRRGIGYVQKLQAWERRNKGKKPDLAMCGCELLGKRQGRRENGERYWSKGGRGGRVIPLGTYSRGEQRGAHAWVKRETVKTVSAGRTSAKCPLDYRPTRLMGLGEQRKNSFLFCIQQKQRKGGGKERERGSNKHYVCLTGSPPHGSNTMGERGTSAWLDCRIAFHRARRRREGEAESAVPALSPKT